ncbi:MAG TPA: NUDIX hydrolase [Solirubrobacteraceae bacterium]|nr:NUDIX hydrolase [Solirubrobacteraceae bacterium]
MSIEPGAQFNHCEPVKPRQAATVIVLRGGARTLEVLLVKRNPEQRFMGGAWVFPGGAVDADEGTGDAAHRAAGVREVQEEAAIELPDPDALVRFSRWSTPEVVAIRFDTHFFLATAPAGADPKPDGGETVDLGWFTPRGAIEAHERDEILLVFPTIKTLEQLAEFSSADALLDWAAGRSVEPVEPKVVGDGPAARLVLPGEPGYER